MPLNEIHQSGVNRKMRRFLASARGQKRLEEYKARKAAGIVLGSKDK